MNSWKPKIQIETKQRKYWKMKIIPDSRITVESPIGPITVEAKDETIVGLAINKRLKPLGSAKVLKNAEQQLKRYFDGKLVAFSLPTLVEGTDFQKQVWSRIAKLGFGEHVSYGDIAKAINRPAAARAVGAAVGANPIPLIVGCHRVLGSSGKITGYTGGKGLITKAWLLKHEKIESKS
jgi:methylated-DNA-[protein]-cysteine S-methyltransferase